MQFRVPGIVLTGLLAITVAVAGPVKSDGSHSWLMADSKAPNAPIEQQDQVGADSLDQTVTLGVFFRDTGGAKVGDWIVIESRAHGHCFWDGRRSLAAGQVIYQAEATEDDAGLMGVELSRNHQGVVLDWVAAGDVFDRSFKYMTAEYLAARVVDPYPAFLGTNRSGS